MLPSADGARADGPGSANGRRGPAGKDRAAERAQGNEARTSGSSPAESGKIRRRKVRTNAQPSDEDGVPEDMATLVLDNPALGRGHGRGRTRWQIAKPALMPPRTRPATQPSCCAWRRATKAGFNYLVEKYHRAMIHFLFRMVHNQAVAEELAQEVFLRVYRSQGELPGRGEVHDLALSDRDQPGGESRARHQARTVGADDLSGRAGRRDGHDAGCGRRRAVGGAEAAAR